jgi:hypothetical protein
VLEPLEWERTTEQRLEVDRLLRDRPHRVQEVLVVLRQRAAQQHLVVVEHVRVHLDERPARMNAGVHRHHAALGRGLDRLLDGRGHANRHVRHVRAAPIGEPFHRVDVVLGRRVDDRVSAHLERLRASDRVRLGHHDDRAR